MTMLNCLNWILLENYYRRFLINEIKWDSIPNNVSHNIEAFNYDSIKVLIGAPFGGPLGILMEQNIMYIYSCSGQYLSSFKVTKVIQMDWSELEHLVCVYENGVYKIIDVYQGQIIKMHEMLTSDKEKKQKVIDARFFRTNISMGLAILTSSFNFFLVNNVYEPKRRYLSKISGNVNQSHKIWTVLSFDRYSEILYTNDLNIYKLKENDSKSINLFSDKNHECCISNPCFIIDMSVSANSKHLAFLCNNGILWMGSSDLQHKYVEFNTEITKKTNGFYWCGTEAIICSWKTIVLLISKQCKYIFFEYDSYVHLVEEIDSIRIISNSRHEIIQKVPNIVEEIFRINSTLVGSLLVEASIQFKSEKYRAYEYLNLIKSNLTLAIDQCVEAAAYEFDIDNQIMLLEAGQYGKCYVSDYDSSKYLEICKILRVLNSIRKSQVAIPLTFKQFECLSPKKLIEKLITRRHFYLAIEISKHLNVKNKDGHVNVLTKWAIYMIITSIEDENILANKIINKLHNIPGIPYYEIAKKANDKFKKTLSKALLLCETRTGLQVKLLMDFNERIPALHKSLENGDPELILNTMLTFIRSSGTNELLMLFRNKFLKTLYINHSILTNSASALTVINQEDNYYEIAKYYLSEYIKFKGIVNDRESINNAKTNFRKAKQDSYSAMCEQTLLLWTYQASFQERFNKKFVGKSTLETISMLLDLNDINSAEKIRSEYRVTERTFFWLQIQVFQKRNDYHLLEQLGKNKRIPSDLINFIQKINSKNNQS